MHENAQNFEWKTWHKISCHYTTEICELGACPVEGQSLHQKDNKWRKRKGKKKIKKTVKPKDVGPFLIHLQILISEHARVTMS